MAKLAASEAATLCAHQVEPALLAPAATIATRVGWLWCCCSSVLLAIDVATAVTTAVAAAIAAASAAVTTDVATSVDVAVVVVVVAVARSTVATGPVVCVFGTCEWLFASSICVHASQYAMPARILEWCHTGKGLGDRL